MPLSSDEVQRDLTPMRRRAMLENIETLPPGGDGNLLLDLAHGETLTAVSALIVTVNEENGMARPRIKHKTWVVVADGGRALVMRNDGDATSPRLTVLRKYGDHIPPTREQGSDKPGRTNASVGVNRSAMEQTDWHRQAEDSLMREVASDLLADLRRQEFSKLILAAAPIALGTLRRAMSDELKAAILAEVDKDLTKMPVPEIGAALAKALEAA